MPSAFRATYASAVKYFPDGPVVTDLAPFGPQVVAAAWQLERCPTTQRLHLQCCLAFTKQQTARSLFRQIPALTGAHLGAQHVKSTFQKQVKYCTKLDTRYEGEDSGPFFYPDMETVLATKEKQGERSDLHAAAESLRTVGLKRTAIAHPTVFMRYHAGMEKLAMHMAPPVAADPDFKPRMWQRKLLSYVATAPDNRTIVYVWDRDGNAGKSVLARNLCISHGAISLSGKVADMAYLYDSERVAVFDIARAENENIRHLYVMAEKLKNGYFTSTKYVPVQKGFKSPHVLFFSNANWDSDLWSKDRVINLMAHDPEFDQPNYNDYPERFRAALMAQDDLRDDAVADDPRNSQGERVIDLTQDDDVPEFVQDSQGHQVDADGFRYIDMV